MKKAELFWYQTKLSTKISEITRLRAIDLFLMKTSRTFSTLTPEISAGQS